MPTLEQEISEGTEAKRVYDLISPYFQTMKDNLHLEWEKEDSLDRREELFKTFQVIKALEKTFTKKMDTAKLASKQLEKERG